MSDAKDTAPQSLHDAVFGFSRIVRRFWPQIRKQSLLIGGACLALLAEVGLRLLEPWPLKFIVDSVLVPRAGGSSGVPAIDALAPETLALLAALAILVLVGARAGASYLSTVGLALAGNRVLTEVRGKLYRHLQRLSLSYHATTRSGDLLTRLTGDIGRLQEVTVTAVLPLLTNTLTLVGMVGIMFWLNWRLALIALSVFPIFML